MGSSVSNYVNHVLANAWSVIEIAVILLCLSLWLHRKNPCGLVSCLKPSSARFNLTVAALDTVLISIPLSYVAFQVNSLILVALDRRTLVNLDSGMFPAILVALLAILCGDLVAYWRHRFEHSRWLWTSHVMHHSDSEMNWSTLYRFHPVNRLTTILIDSIALVMIGFPTWALILNGLVRHYYGAFIHINQPWTLGWAGNILVSPAMHRWHHVYEGEGVGTNFASVFSFIDRAFGTYYCPGPCISRLGVPGVHADDLRGQYLLPFRRQ